MIIIIIFMLYKKMEKLSSRRYKSVPKKKYFKYSEYFTKTFASKLFMKLTEHKLDKSIVCFQILQFELANRRKEEIIKASTFLTTIKKLYDYICLKENNPTEISKLLYEVTRFLFYKYQDKLSILRRPNENLEKIIIIMSGKVKKLSLVFKKIFLTFEEYLIFLIEMKLIKENGIISKCKILNKKHFEGYISIDENNMQYFFENNPQFDYNKLKNIAVKNLIAENLITSPNAIYYDKFNKILSFENYSKIGNLPNGIKNSEISQNKAKIFFYIPHYELAAILNKGDIIGDFTYSKNDDNYSYICEDHCDIGIIKNKQDLDKEKTLVELFNCKKEKLFNEIKNKFYLLQNINGTPKIIIKTYYKGDKIFIQNSLYDGIYLINNGEIKTYLKIVLSEIPQFLLELQQCINGFSEYISTINLEKKENFDYDKNQQKIGDLFFNNKIELGEDFQKEYEMFLFYSTQGDFLGLNEYYDYKTKLFNFTAECVSETAELYLIPFSNIDFLYANNQVKKQIFLMVESKIRYLKSIINSQKNKILKEVNSKNLKNTNSIKHSSPKNLFLNKDSSSMKIKKHQNRIDTNKIYAKSTNNSKKKQLSQNSCLTIINNSNKNYYNKLNYDNISTNYTMNSINSKFLLNKNLNTPIEDKIIKEYNNRYNFPKDRKKEINEYDNKKKTYLRNYISSNFYNILNNCSESIFIKKYHHSKGKNYSRGCIKLSNKKFNNNLPDIINKY